MLDKLQLLIDKLKIFNTILLTAGVAQLVEHGTENPGVGGSIPPPGI